jgi:toxin HigB-1
MYQCEIHTQASGALRKMALFKNKMTETVAEGICPKGFPPSLLKVARRKIMMVRVATRLDDLKSPPGNKLHALDRDRAGQHAIWINAQFRVCFTWTENGAEEIEVTDYH